MKTLLRFLLLSFVASLTTLSASAQYRFSVGLSNGEEIRASKIKFRTPAFSKAFIEADGERYGFEEVEYYSNEDGFFQKLLPPNAMKEDFFRREVDGPRLSAYSRLMTTMSYNGAMGTGAPVMQTQRVDYYVKDDGPVQMMTFSNLRKDLADNPACLPMLRSVKNLRIVTGLMYAAGAAMVISGVSTTFKKADGPSDDGGGIPPLFVAGAVTLAVPWVIFRPMKRKKMMEAVMIYNKRG